MTSAEVIKKKGRPKKTIAETITILAEPVAVKAKKPRVSRKSTPISPSDQLGQRDFTSARAQPPQNDEALPLSREVIKQSKSRSMKSVAAETAILASRQVKAPSTRPEPSLILKEATAFVEGQKAESSSTSSDLVKGNPQIHLPKIKSAGTLSSFSGLEASKPATSTPSPPSQPKTSPFLTDFFTEPVSAEQPAWSRPKKAATVSSPLNNSPEPTQAAEAAPPESQSETSAPPLPPGRKSSAQSSAEGQILQEAACTAESQSAALPWRVPTRTTQRIQPATPPNTPANPTSHAAMSPTQPTHGLNSAPTPPSNTAPPPPTRRVGPVPKMPLRVASASGQKPLKPTETPYEVLRHDPKFKALSRRWTSLIVAIPILVATSYALYARYTETAGQRRRGRNQGMSTINGGV